MREIALSDLEIGMVLAKDVYADGVSVPVVARNTVITLEIIERLEHHRFYRLYIDDNARRKRLIIPTPPPAIAPQLRQEALESISELFSAAMSGSDETDAGNSAAQINTVVDQLVETLADDSRAMVNIRDLKSYDDYTYHHSLSVALISIAIGQKLNMSRDQLITIGRAAIMHDIGKTAIPIEIINKPARLTSEEFELVKTHCAQGYDYLRRNQINDETIWRYVLYHHEKLDGTGYPHGISGNDMPIASRIISVADVFDALTSKRSYRQPMMPNDAMEYLMAGVDSSFDYDVVLACQQKLELFPAGSFVELSNGMRAVVINTEHNLRPIVQDLRSADIIDLFRDWKYLSVTIVRIIPPEEIDLTQA